MRLAWMRSSGLLSDIDLSSLSIGFLVGGKILSNQTVKGGLMSTNTTVAIIVIFVIFTGLILTSIFARRLARTSALLLIVALASYYLIIFTHWDLFIGWLVAPNNPLFGNLFVSPITLTMLLIVVFLLFPLSAKYSAATVGAGTLVGLFTILMTLIIAVTVISQLVNRAPTWIELLRSDYLVRYHKFWIGLICVLGYILLFEYSRKKADIYKFLDDFKTFPLASPVFCFGVPAFWNKNLVALGLSSQVTTSLGALSILSGVAFLISMLLFFVVRNPIEDEENHSIVLPENIRIPHTKNDVIIQLSLLLTMLGLAGITYVVIALAYLIIIS